MSIDDTCDTQPTKYSKLFTEITISPKIREKKVFRDGQLDRKGVLVAYTTKKVIFERPVNPLHTICISYDASNNQAVYMESKNACFIPVRAAVEKTSVMHTPSQSKTMVYNRRTQTFEQF